MTFSIVDSRVDEVEILLSNLNSLTSQLAHMILDNEEQQDVITGTFSEDFSAGVTLSLFMQANNTQDISSDLNSYMGIKAVTVEVLP